MPRMSFWFSVVALISLFFLSGCQFLPLNKSRKGTAVGGSVLATLPPLPPVAGERFSETSRLPENFPKDLPIYPLVKFLSEEKLNSRSGFVLFSAAVPSQQITKYYEETLEPSGWTIEARSQDKNNFSFSVSKGRMTSSIGIKDASGNTLLSITFGPGGL